MNSFTTRGLNRESHQSPPNKVGAAGGQFNHFLGPLQGRPCMSATFPPAPGRNWWSLQFSRARIKGGPNPPFGGCRLTSPCTPVGMPPQPAQRGPEARPSHFPPPSSEKTKNSRHPAEGGSSAGLIPAPPPAGANPALGGPAPAALLPRMATRTTPQRDHGPGCPQGQVVLSSPHPSGAAERPRSPP